MKKLALVIALAVAASWMLSDRPDRDTPATRSLRDLDRSIRHDQDNARRDLAKGRRGRHRPAPPAPPEPPTAPVALLDDMPSRGRRPEAAKAPAWFPASGREEDATRDESAGERVLIGRLSASEDRARRDLDERLAREVRDWLAADVSPTWTPPARELASMTLDSYIQPVAQVFKPLPGETEAAASSVTPTAGSPSPVAEAKASVLDDVYTLYRAGGRFDFSSNRKAKLIEIYRRQVVDGRLQKLGGGVVLALAALAALAGYIRADEATKGFYTNRLRLAAAAGLGASGYAVYRVLM
ncbi:hypothetical protein TA3x_001966 [Tundrisphaera sp. TA3]|uniref:hypothetical protein n=1 Tax=Tundrisphaera sp. TA3 TaxID=3435775 RepID=UPI003EBD547D